MLQDQLLKARKAAGKTQKDVADYLGIDESTYCGYEKGKCRPNALRIKKIATFLGVTGDYLLETGLDQESTPPIARNAVFCETADEIRLIRFFRALNDSGRSAALSAVKGLAENAHFKEESLETKSMA